MPRHEAAIIVDIKPKALRTRPPRSPLPSRVCRIFVGALIFQVFFLIYYEGAVGVAAASNGRRHTHGHDEEEQEQLASHQRWRRVQSPPVAPPPPPMRVPDDAPSTALPSGGVSATGQAAHGLRAAEPQAAGSNAASGAGTDALDGLGYRGDLTIPKLFHQSWRDDGFPKDMFNWRWQAGLVDLNPGWTLMRWTDASSRRLIATEYRWFLAAYDAYPSYIQRSDAARYFIVYHHGGLYLDLDYECSRPFAPVLAGARAAFSFKVGTNVSRGLANAIFATEARHPVWPVVFDLLLVRAATGATAASHVDVIRSTGPGLLRAAVEAIASAAPYPGLGQAPVGGERGVAGDGGDGREQAGGAVGREEEALSDTRRLDALGVRLLPSAVWHPLLPEQKHGRDASPQTLAQIGASYCVHHFVSSWVVHDKTRHTTTDAARREAAAAAGASAQGDRALLPVPGTVPVGQALRTSNTWRSFELDGVAAEALATGAGQATGGEPSAMAAGRATGRDGVGIPAAGGAHRPREASGKSDGTGRRGRAAPPPAAVTDRVARRRRRKSHRKGA